MKKRYIISVVSMLLLGLTVSAQTISVEEVTARPQETTTISIDITEASEYVASGFNITLPEGFIFTGDAVEGIESSKVTVNLQDDCAMRAAVYSSKNESFSNDKTRILNVLVTPNCKPGTYQGRLSGVEFANNSLELKKMDDVTFNIIVKNMYGDVNSDNKVTITDAVGIVNDILGNPSANFDRDAANINGDIDDNGDPKITITDAVGVVNIILDNGSGSSSAPKMQMPQDENAPAVAPEATAEPE